MAITTGEHERLLRIEKATLDYVGRPPKPGIPSDAEVARLRDVEEQVISFVDGDESEEDCPEMRELRVSVGRTPRRPSAL